MRAIIQNRHLRIFLLIGLLLLPNLVWILTDRSVWPWDPSWYAETSMRIAQAFSVDWDRGVFTMLNAFGIKAPGIAWLGMLFVPLGYLANGHYEIALLLEILISQIASLYVIYLIAKQLFKQEKIAYLAAIITGSAPLFIAMTNQFFVESLQMLAVELLVLVMVKARSLTRYTLILLLVTISAYSLIIKISSPLYLVFVVPVICYFILRPGNKISFKSYFSQPRNYLVYALGALITAGSLAWYYKNFQTITSFAISTSSGPIAEDYGTKAAFLVKLQYWLTAFSQSFYATPVMILLGILFAFVLFRFFSKRHYRNLRTKKNRDLMVALVVSLLTVVLVLGIFCFQINQEVRYLLPMLPFSVILICFGVSYLNMRNMWVLGLIVLAFAAQFLVTQAVALGMMTRPQEISYWVIPRDTTNVHRQNLITALDLTCKPETSKYYMIIGVEYSEFNFDSADFYAVRYLIKDNIFCIYTSLGYFQKDLAPALKKVNEAPYFLTIDPNAKGYQFDPNNNKLNTEILKIVQADPNFKLIHQTNDGILIYRNLAILPVQP